MALPHRWDDIAYLRDGTARQRQAYEALVSLNVMEVLKAHAPVLCGTIPLGVDVPGSDLDVICEAWDLAVFEREVARAYSHHAGYNSRFRRISGYPACICDFEAEGFAFQMFAQPRKVREIDSYRHMAVEARLLSLAGPDAAEAIRELKAGGMKTEPAFARYFGLQGDPYATLLALYAATDDELRALIRT